jgi:hypothetical protein
MQLCYTDAYGNEKTMRSTSQLESAFRGLQFVSSETHMSAVTAHLACTLHWFRYNVRPSVCLLLAMLTAHRLCRS